MDDFNLDEIASAEFLQGELDSMLAFIEVIEQKYRTELVGDRNDLNARARYDLQGKTVGQVIFFMNYWKKSLLQKYPL